MIMQQRVGFLGLLALLASLVATTMAASIDMTYCASLNTASTSANSSIYQSDGLCHDFCVDSYAFSIIQDDSCWCSDYAPDTSIQVDTSQCNTACPGFPSDTCGGSGLFGYMQLNKSPVGTKGAATSTSATQAQTTSQTQAKTTTSQVRDTETTAVDTPTTTASPSVSVATVTAGGTVSLQTVTVIPTVSSSGSSAEINSTPSNGLTTGAAVGVAVGVLGAVVAIAAVIIVFWLKRRRQRKEEEMLQRNGSHRGSSSGIMGTPRTEMTGASTWDGGEYLPRRNSRMMPHDPRMDPFAGNIYGTRFENRSHETINTLEDNQDYSRKVLRTTNPDPED